MESCSYVSSSSSGHRAVCDTCEESLGEGTALHGRGAGRGWEGAGRGKQRWLPCSVCCLREDVESCGALEALDYPQLFQLMGFDSGCGSPWFQGSGGGTPPDMLWQLPAFPAGKEMGRKG